MRTRWMVVAALAAISVGMSYSPRVSAQYDQNDVDEPDAPAQNASMPDAHLVKEGDTLWTITEHYYGNAFDWPKLWSINPEITNPHWIYPADVIRLREGAAARFDTGQAKQVSLADTMPNGHFKSGTVWLREEAYLDKEALKQSGEVIGSRDETMMLSTYDPVYIRFGNELPTVGSELSIFREIDEDEREEDEPWGVLVRVFGTVKILRVDSKKKQAEGLIVEALDPIERGYRVAPIPRRFDQVSPVKNGQDLRGEIVATMRKRELIAQNQLVFVNKGEKDGVVPGNRFFVVRRGDRFEAARDEYDDQGQKYVDREVPESTTLLEEIVAEGTVVYVRKNHAAMVITRSVEDLQIGDQVEMRAGY